MFLPPGFNRVPPYFYVDDAPAFIEFPVNGLGGMQVLRAFGEDGRVASAQNRLEKSTVVVSERPLSHRQMRAAHYLYVEDTDKAMVRAIWAWATQILSVQNMDYGDRQGGARHVTEIFGGYRSNGRKGRNSVLLATGTLRLNSSQSEDLTTALRHCAHACRGNAA